MSGKHRRKPFRSQSVLHLYQNTVNGYLLFYSLIDRLAFFSLVCLAAPKYGIRLLGLCLMPDHVHMLLETGNRRSLVVFTKEVFSRFSKNQNRWLGRKGQLFRRTYGCALKIGHKAIRTAIAYLFNNPVEKQLCELAEEYRWNFLAYSQQPFPFSEPFAIRRASPAMQRAIRTIRNEHEDGRPLSFPLLNNLLRGLSSAETEQLTDYAISLYSVIDHSEIISYYGSYETVLTAVHANTGSEYDIREDRDVKSDVPYGAIEGALLSDGRFKHVHDILRLEESARKALFAGLLRTVAAPSRLMEKFLRLEPKESVCHKVQNNSNLHDNEYAPARSRYSINN